MKRIIGAIPDVLVITGALSLSYGASLIHLAAGFITAGVVMLALGWISASKVSE